MPFKSEAQRRFLFAKHPEIAREFARHTPKGVKLPKHLQVEPPPKAASVGTLLGNFAGQLPSPYKLQRPTVRNGLGHFQPNARSFKPLRTNLALATGTATRIAQTGNPAPAPPPLAGS